MLTLHLLLLHRQVYYFDMYHAVHTMLRLFRSCSAFSLEGIPLQGQLAMTGNETRRIGARCCSCIRCESGTVLLTQEGDRQDHILQGGDEFRPRADGMLVIWAFSDASLTLIIGGS